MQTTFKPGEFVRVVAINRATGYVGNARVELKLSENEGGGGRALRWKPRKSS